MLRTWLDYLLGPPTIRKNGTEHTKRPVLELEAGTGVTIDVTDQPTSDATRVRISSTGGGGGATPGGSDGDLQRNDGGALAPIKRADNSAAQDKDIARKVAGKWCAEPPIEVPSAAAPGDFFFYDGTNLARLAKPTTDGTFGIVWSGGVPTGWASSSPPAFDPASMALTGYWWKPAGTTVGSPITGPWAGTSSAGASGSRSLTAGALPLLGANFGTHPSADFSGAGHYLVLGGGLKLIDLLSRAAYFIQVVFEADTVAAPAAQPHSDKLLFGDNGGNIYLGIATSGIRFGHYDDVSFKATGFVACSTGQKHCVQAWYDGTNLNLRLNGGSTVSIAAGQLTTAATSLIPRVGANHDASVFFDGRIAQIITRNAVPTSTERDSLQADAKANFGTV